MTSAPNPADTRPTIYAVGPSLGTVWRWWRAELAACVPSALRDVLSPHARVMSISMGDNDTAVVRDVRLPLAGQRGLETHFSGSWRDAVARVAARRKQWGPLLRVDLIIPHSRCLVLEHRIPVHALGKATDILSLEMERITPLRRAQVLQDFFIIGSDPGPHASAVVQQVAILKSAVQPVLADLSTHGAGADTILVENQDGTLLPVNLLAHLADQPATNSGRLNRLLAAAAIVALLLTLYHTLAGIWALQTALNEQTQMETSLKQQVAAVRLTLATQDSAQNRANGLRLRKSELVTTLQVWEEVTQLLPGSAWISDLRHEDGALYLDGFSRSASELVGIFSRSNIFAKVEFVSPVTRDTQHGVERFQLRMKVERRTHGTARQTAAREVAP